jgi:hypothetical protein
MKDNKFLKSFMAEVNEEVYELVKLMCMKQGMTEDVVFMFILGVYDEDEDDESLNVSLSASVEEPEEFDQLVSTAIDIYNVAIESEEPKENTIDWWINKYGNGSIN